MVMSWIWTGMVAVSFLAAAFLGNGGALSAAIPKGAQEGFLLAVSLAGSICLWTGVGKLMEYAGLTGEETVLDLYCGTGTITLCLAKQAKKAIGAEIVEPAIRDAWENAERNQVKNVEFFCGDSADIAEKLEKDGLKPDVITVDPPRKGLAPEVIASVAGMGPKKVVYVSCDAATLGRDVKIFAGFGYKTVRACAVDMFPGTRHVESVALLVKE